MTDNAINGEILGAQHVQEQQMLTWREPQILKLDENQTEGAAGKNFSVGEIGGAYGPS